MKVSDYIVNFLEEKGIKHVYGYQGTMIAHFVDSLGKSKKITNHCVYNEQAAAFAAVGAAKTTGKCAVAYSTSGPGALNLISGIADAYYDSVPVLFITGQVNTTEYTGIEELRQQAFQETKVLTAVSTICKYSVFVDDAEKIVEELDKAWEIANEGRKGPVVLDIPMNIQRADISVERKEKKECTCDNNVSEYAKNIMEHLKKSKRPVFILGNGIGKDEVARQNVKRMLEMYKVPVITTLLGRDLIDSDDELNMGVIGAAYGHRYANLIAYEKTDLLISFGASLCRRQTSGRTEDFAQNATIIRIDIDENELRRVLHDEIHMICDVNVLIEALLNMNEEYRCEEWVETCNYIKQRLVAFDDECQDRYPNKVIEALTEKCEDAVVVADVGQHMMWTMQSAHVKNNRLLFSGGHGAMGFAMPAAIGAQIETGKKVICIAGDGSFQMNIQELQWVFREQIPICIVVMNNNSLGLIRQQQDDFFNSYYAGATSEGGYTSPQFSKIAGAYGIENYLVETIEALKETLDSLDYKKPVLIEYRMEPKTVAVPKTYFGETMIDQKPYIARELLDELLKV